MYKCMYACMHVCMYACNVCMYVCMYVCIDSSACRPNHLELEKTNLFAATYSFCLIVFLCLFSNSTSVGLRRHCRKVTAATVAKCTHTHLYIYICIYIYIYISQSPGNCQSKRSRLLDLSTMSPPPSQSPLPCWGSRMATHRPSRGVEPAHSGIDRRACPPRSGRASPIQITISQPSSMPEKTRRPFGSYIARCMRLRPPARSAASRIVSRCCRYAQYITVGAELAFSRASARNIAVSSRFSIAWLRAARRHNFPSTAFISKRGFALYRYKAAIPSPTRGGHKHESPMAKNIGHGYEALPMHRQSPVARAMRDCARQSH